MKTRLSVFFLLMLILVLLCAPLAYAQEDFVQILTSDAWTSVPTDGSLYRFSTDGTGSITMGESQTIAMTWTQYGESLVVRYNLYGERSFSCTLTQAGGGYRLSLEDGRFFVRQSDAASQGGYPQAYGIEAGMPIQLGFTQITVDSVSVSGAIHRNGFHFIADSGMQMVVLTASIKNGTGSQMNVGSGILAEVVVDGLYAYPAQVRTESSNQESAVLPAQGSGVLLVYAQVPDEVVSSMSSTCVYFGFNDHFAPHPGNLKDSSFLFSADLAEEALPTPTPEPTPEPTLVPPVTADGSFVKPGAYLISFSQEQHLPFVSFSVDSAKAALKVQGSSRTGLSWSAKDGTVLLIFSGSIRNNSGKSLNLFSNSLAGFSIGGHPLTNARIYTEVDGVLSSKLPPRAEGRLLFCIEVPLELIPKLDSAILTFAFCDDFAAAPTSLETCDYLYMIELPESMVPGLRQELLSQKEASERELVFFSEIPFLPAPPSFADAHGKADSRVCTFSCPKGADAALSDYQSSLASYGFTCDSSVIYIGSTALASVSCDGDKLVVSLDPHATSLTYYPECPAIPAPTNFINVKDFGYEVASGAAASSTHYIYARNDRSDDSQALLDAYLAELVLRGFTIDGEKISAGTTVLGRAYLHGKQIRVSILSGHTQPLFTWTPQATEPMPSAAGTPLPASYYSPQTIDMKYVISGDWMFKEDLHLVFASCVWLDLHFAEQSAAIDIFNYAIEHDMVYLSSSDSLIALVCFGKHDILLMVYSPSSNTLSFTFSPNNGPATPSFSRLVMEQLVSNGTFSSYRHLDGGMLQTAIQAGLEEAPIIH